MARNIHTTYKILICKWYVILQLSYSKLNNQLQLLFSLLYYPFSLLLFLYNRGLLRGKVLEGLNGKTP